MTDPTTHPFVLARLSPEEVELAELAFWELGATGIEQRDDTTIVREATPGEVMLIVAFAEGDGVRILGRTEPGLVVAERIERAIDSPAPAGDATKVLLVEPLPTLDTAKGYGGGFPMRMLRDRPFAKSLPVGPLGFP